MSGIKDKLVAIRFDKDEVELIEDFARKQRGTKSYIIRKILLDYIEEHNRKENR